MPTGGNDAYLLVTPGCQGHVHVIERRFIRSEEQLKRISELPQHRPDAPRHLLRERLIRGDDLTNVRIKSYSSHLISILALLSHLGRLHENRVRHLCDPSAIVLAFFVWFDVEESVVQQGRKGLIFLMISGNNERPNGVYPSFSCSWFRQVYTLRFEPIKHELVDGIEQFLVTVVHCGVGMEHWSDVDHRLEEFDFGQYHFGEVFKRKFITDFEACQVRRQRALLKEGYPVEVRFLPCKLQDDIRPSVVDLPCPAERICSANPEGHVGGIFYVQLPCDEEIGQLVKQGNISNTPGGERRHGLHDLHVLEVLKILRVFPHMHDALHKVFDLHAKFRAVG
mmetsp:Transcript_8262/g.22906  ORF Transcript_8262/g.22906 Transcript_8262/m.22906 type:complete len:338 (-) Transcript_8262:974-1987(-)